MAKKKKKPQLSKRQQRKIRTQQVIFGVVAVILIGSMLVSLFT
jgi:predicted nucleic acid-binding Zn ribbon protein